MMRTTTILFMFVAMMLLASCGRDIPRRQREPAPPEQSDPSGTRPGQGGGEDFESELADACWRFKGPSLTLRYDRGGVLVRVNADSSADIIDLDGASTVTASMTAARTDSLCPGSEIKVDGRLLAVAEIKLMKITTDARWYRILSPDSALHTLVLPPL